MRLSLIGPGDIEYHFQELLKIPEQEFQQHLNQIAQALADSNAELVILPDKGVSFQIAKLVKQKSNNNIIAAIPKSDKTFGIKHLEPYTNSGIINKTIDTENWYKHDLIKALLGNAVLYLGSSPGTNGELNYAIYLYKLLTNRKEEIKIAGKFIHPEIRADTNYTIFIYQPFLKNKKLNPELEAYIKKFNINLIYIKDSEHLKKELENFSKLN